MKMLIQASSAERDTVHRHCVGNWSQNQAESRNGTKTVQLEVRTLLI